MPVQKRLTKPRLFGPLLNKCQTEFICISVDFSGVAINLLADGVIFARQCLPVFVLG